MNLDEFLKLRTSCPMCDNQKLITYFQAGSIINTRYVDNKLVAIKDLKPLNRRHDYFQVGYYFSLVDNSFSIEFFGAKNNQAFDQVNMNLLEKFKTFDGNIKRIYRFRKECHSCHNYLCNTMPLDIDFKKSTADISIRNEVFYFITKTEEDYKVTVLHNEHNDNSSIVVCWRDDSLSNILNMKWPNTKYSKYDLPLIPFISKEETNTRLNTLLLFS